MERGRGINCTNAIYAKEQNNRMKYDCVAGCINAIYVYKRCVIVL